jgi:DNA-binding response OmpR family regulator
LTMMSGYDVIEAESGDKAVESFRSNDPDVINGVVMRDMNVT